VTFAQLCDCGVSKHEIGARVTEGWLLRRHNQVYAVGHVPRSRTSSFHAAVLALGEESALSHRAAGGHLGAVRGAVPLEVTVPTLGGRRPRDGIIVHRAPLPAAHVRSDGGMRVTTALRTTLDLAAVLDIRPLGSAFEEMQVHHGLAPDLLAAEVLSRRGYRGNGKLAGLLVDAVDPQAVRSILELRFLKLCAANRIPRPQVNIEIGPWTPDFFWPDHELIVETDGLKFHRTAAARRRDAAKDDYMRALGLVVVRLRWTDVADSGCATAARILDALREAP
jgi:very-short-patch-repair endonuclease